MKIKKGDTVKLISGKDAGKTGKVVKVFPKISKAIVENINLVVKHVKPRRQYEKGQRVSVPAAVDISNLMLICPKCSRTTRVGMKVLPKSKVRICKKCNGEISSL